VYFPDVSVSIPPKARCQFWYVFCIFSKRYYEKRSKWWHYSTKATLRSAFFLRLSWVAKTQPKCRTNEVASPRLTLKTQETVPELSGRPSFEADPAGRQNSLQCWWAFMYPLANQFPHIIFLSTKKRNAQGMVPRYLSRKGTKSS